MTNIATPLIAEQLAEILDEKLEQKLIPLKITVTALRKSLDEVY